METVILKILPLALLLGLGIYLQRVKDITLELMNGLKFIILRLSLPSILFFAFTQAPLELKYGWLFLIMFLFCCWLYTLGDLFFKKYLKYDNSYTLISPAILK